MSARMHELDDGSVTAIYVYGTYYRTSEEAAEPALKCMGNFASSLAKNIAILEEKHAYLYLKEVIGFELSYYRSNPSLKIPVMEKWENEPAPADWQVKFPCVTRERAGQITQSQEFLDMPIWPAAGSVAVIDDTIVVKLSEAESKTDAGNTPTE